TGDLNAVAWFDDGVFPLPVKLRISRLHELIGSFIRRNIRSMIDEFLDRDARGKLGHSTEMVAVPVRRNQVIDLLDAGIFHRRHDPAGVARCCSTAVAGVDEHGLTGWTDEKCRVTAFNVDDINLERLRHGSKWIQVPYA